MQRHRTAPRRTAHRTHAKPHGAVATPRPASPAAEALARRIATLALDKKALDVVILDVRGMTSYADYFVIASGDSERQVAATAEHIREQLKQGGVSPVGSEGFESGHWVLLDYGEVVAHLFQNDARVFYDLEGLWSDAPRERVA
jgi:ribosome-associated protein